MTTGASTSPSARDRRPLPQAVVPGQVRLQMRGHELLAFRLLQAHPQQLRIIQSRPREAAGVRDKAERKNLKKGEPGDKAKKRAEERAAKAAAPAEEAAAE